MTDGYLLNLRAFREVEDSKPQALKPLEDVATRIRKLRGEDR